ncbi:DUF1153 domain-containing protein [Novosphingobium sp. M1R2S20]|uniref:DUF1153 domain-containing protein n=1 Tax=Novosphingobium rhizovicinum TaxID=3228928 RepID=A0ABV3RCY6_9SPHN
MLHGETVGSDKVVGLLGEELTIADLPPPHTSRWVAQRKAEVVAAVNGGLLSVREACDRYHLSLEELGSWQRMVKLEGVSGLRASRVQHYRKGHEAKGANTQV